MEFSVNLNEIHNHLDILHREKDTVDALIVSLNMLDRQNAETMMHDPVLIQKQLESTRKISANIRRRIEFLQSAAEEFQMLMRSTDCIFTEALDLAEISDLEKCR